LDLAQFKAGTQKDVELLLKLFKRLRKLSITFNKRQFSEEILAPIAHFIVTSNSKLKLAKNFIVSEREENF
jgi:hypothetical protein